MFVLTEDGSQRKDPLVDGGSCGTGWFWFLPVELEVTVVFIVWQKAGAGDVCLPCYGVPWVSGGFRTQPHTDSVQMWR